MKKLLFLFLQELMDAISNILQGYRIYRLKTKNLKSFGSSKRFYGFACGGYALIL